MRKVFGLMLAVSIVLTGFLPAQTLEIPKITEAPRLDGMLDEPVWQQAALITEFYRPGSTDPVGDTTVRLAYDAQYLYVGIICSNANMSHVIQQTMEHDGAVNLDESVELFLRPDVGSECYYHLMLNFAGIRHDKRITEAGKRELDWDPAWRVRTRRTDEGWTAEVALPWHALENEKVEALQLNIIRNAKEIELDAYGALESEKRVARVLKSGAHGSSHAFRNFRPVSGLESITVKMPPRVISAEAFGYQMVKQGAAYDLALTLEPATEGSGEIELVVIEEENGSDREVYVQKVILESGASKSLILTVPTSRFVERAVRVQLRAVGSPGNVLGERDISNPAALNILQKAFVGRSYYTTEKTADILIELADAPALLKTIEASLELDGQKVARSKGLQARTKLAIPLSKLKTGANEIDLQLSVGKHEAARRKIEIRRLPPKPGQEIKVDYVCRALLKDGKPYFPFALYASNLSEEALREMAEAGFTTIVRWGRVSITQTLATAGTVGLDVFEHPYQPINEYLPPKGERPWSIMPRNAEHQRELLAMVNEALSKGIPEIEDNIKLIRDDPNLFGYYNFDEPTLGNSEARLTAARAIFEAVRRADPYRPVFCGFQRKFPERPDEVADLFSSTVYLRPGFGEGEKASYGFAGEMTVMTVYMLRLKAVAERFNRPGMGVALSEALDPLRSPRGIMPDEKRCSTYLSVIHGVKGIFHWVDARIYTQAMWDTLAALAKEMKVIGPAALSGEVYPAARYAPVDLDLKKETFPDVQATLFKNPAGGYLLLAANVALYPVDVRYTVPGIKAEAGVKRLFQEQNLTADKDGFTDQLEPYGTRAYVLELLPTAAKPVELALEITGHPDKALKRKRFHPEQDFKGKKNCVANPSFEEAEIPFFPDWVQPLNPPIPRMGMPGAEALMDPEHKVHGKYSFKETIVLPARSRRGMIGMVSFPYSEKPFRVTVSAYVKGSENVKRGYLQLTGMHFAGADPKWPDTVNFAVTKEWQRVIFRGEMDFKRAKPDTGRKSGNRFNVIYSIGPGIRTAGFHPWRDLNNQHAVLNVPYAREHMLEATGTAEFWIDAVQVECGEEATEFTVE